MNPPLHPQIERLVIESAHEMGAATVAGILGCSYDTVKRLAAAGEISCQVVTNARKETEEERARRGVITTRRNKRAKERRTFTKLDVLAYIIRSTTGDRSIVLRAVEQLCPHWLAFAEDTAASAALPLPAWLRRRQEQQAPKRLPKNVVRMDPYAGHPELFPQTHTQTATA